jgi:ribosomal protein S27E
MPGAIDAAGEKRERAFMTEPARSIGKLGFRKWYERRLIESHAWLITCFLCGLAIAASLEGVSFTRAESLPLLVFVFVGGLICWHALNRYRAIMDEAERLGESAVCGSCKTYGAFSVLGSYPKMNVRCRKCGHEWHLDT